MTDKRPLLFPVLLVVISAVASWAFACVTPFAAIAVAAAYTLPARSALRTMAAVWLVNQAIGFIFLGYPWAADTVLWGLAIGMAALLAGALACAMMRLVRENMAVAVAAALIVAFGAYEAGLLLVTSALGGQETFAPAIVGQLALMNAGWTAALVGMCEMLRYTGATGGGRVSPAGENTAALPS